MMKRKELCLPQQQMEKLEAEAKLTGLNVSEIIRRAIDFFFSHKELTNGERTDDNNETRS